MTKPKPAQRPHGNTGNTHAQRAAKRATKFLHMRLTEDDQRRLTAYAQAGGFASVAEYVRARCL